MVSPELIKEYFKQTNVDVQCDRALSRIHEYQQNKIFSYELIFFVIIGGIFVNLISSAIFDISYSSSVHDNFQMILVSLFFLIVLLLIYYLAIEKYFPKDPVTINISVSIFDLYRSLGYEKNDAINIIENEGFNIDKFSNFLDRFKTDIINLNFLYQMYKFNFKNEEAFSYGKSLLYVGNIKNISLQLKIILNPYPNVIRENNYNSIVFMLSYQILNPENPDVDEFIFDFKEYLIDIVFEEFCDTIYEKLPLLN